MSCNGDIIATKIINCSDENASTFNNRGRTFFLLTDSPSLWLSNCIQGHDERGRLMRRTIMRYINLSLILTLRLVCLPVKKRFPHYDHLVEAGILEKREKEVKHR